MRVWLGVIGVIVPLVGGLTFGMLDWAQVFNPMPAMAFYAILAVLGLAVAGVGGYLLRTWWSLAIMPVAFLVGVLITDVLMIASGASFSETFDYEVALLGWYLTPTLVGAAFGTALALRGWRGTRPHEGIAPPA